ncbi:arginase [Herbihabitans rhizosphaerae]|uniref:Arginase n=1 Tax=Herbihabitans rhizosphaerae TaxID=1872711 RepID=A0A4Q7KD40_9PSEU|nr:arginase family protein [Herbihabitans rhizosphaerae]RZS29459.1 arginase [Herbihabitans rhizosphaerae]
MYHVVQSRVVLIEAPTNLGLREPESGAAPGCAKAPGALRDAGLVTALGAEDGGHLVAPRYNRSAWREGDGVFHASKIADYSRALADRIGGALVTSPRLVVVIGGDCSILLGAGLALRRTGRRYGLAFLDGHSDFRHPGNSDRIGAAAGEDLALATGRGQVDLSNVDGHGPLFADSDVVVLGIRSDDEDAAELRDLGIAHGDVESIRAEGPAATATWARERLEQLDGFWVHVDVDVLDPSVVSAVDSPAPGGLTKDELTTLLAGLLASPRCAGIELTVFDPDLDPTGAQARLIVEILTDAVHPHSN